MIAIVIADLLMDYFRIQYKRYKRKQKKLMLEKLKTKKQEGGLDAKLAR